MEYKEISIDIPKKPTLNQQQHIVLPLKSTIWACAEMEQKTAVLTDDFSSVPKVGTSRIKLPL